MVCRGWQDAKGRRSAGYPNVVRGWAVLTLAGGASPSPTAEAARFWIGVR